MPAPAERVVAIERSPNGDVLVVDDGERLILRLGSVCGPDQGAICKADPEAVSMEYLRYAAVATALPRRLDRVLVVGLGTGTFPHLVHRCWPEATTDVVELDAVVVRVARRWFDLHEDRRLRVVVAEGGDFIAAARTSWDLVLVDAYGPRGLPGKLREEAFFTALRDHVTSDGAVAMNLAVRYRLTEERIVAALARRFRGLAAIRTPRSGNLVVLASPRPLPGRAELAQRLHRIERQRRPGFPLAPAAARLRALGPCQAGRFSPESSPAGRA